MFYENLLNYISYFSYRFLHSQMNPRKYIRNYSLWIKNQLKIFWIKVKPTFLFKNSTWNQCSILNQNSIMQWIKIVLGQNYLNEIIRIKILWLKIFNFLYLNSLDRNAYLKQNSIFDKARFWITLLNLYQKFISTLFSKIP